ncbi:MAG: DUF1588 domain-containing protein [Polyangiaceae bacterium]
MLPSPILRAKTIRSSIMCKPVPPPSTIKDLEIPPAPNASVTGKTTRDLYTAHVANTVCKGCHDSMDPVGFGLGKFDATGRLFADGKENSISIDASGDFHSTASDLDGKTFSDQSAMIDALAGSTQVRSCFALEQFRYALGRIEDAADACMLQQLYADFSGANFNLKKLMISVVRSPAFRTRKVVSAGSACQ